MLRQREEMTAPPVAPGPGTVAVPGQGSRLALSHEDPRRPPALPRAVERQWVRVAVNLSLADAADFSASACAPIPRVLGFRSLRQPLRARPAVVAGCVTRQAQRTLPCQKYVAERCPRVPQRSLRPLRHIRQQQSCCII